MNLFSQLQGTCRHTRRSEGSIILMLLQEPSYCHRFVQQYRRDDGTLQTAQRVVLIINLFRDQPEEGLVAPQRTNQMIVRDGLRFHFRIVFCYKTPENQAVKAGDSFLVVVFLCFLVLVRFFFILVAAILFAFCCVDLLTT